MALAAALAVVAVPRPPLGANYLRLAANDSALPLLQDGGGLLQRAAPEGHTPRRKPVLYSTRRAWRPLPGPPTRPGSRAQARLSTLITLTRTLSEARL